MHPTRLQQFETGAGDYAMDRQEWVDATPLSAFNKKQTASRRKRKA
jgi:hypothetical protein